MVGGTADRQLETLLRGAGVKCRFVAEDTVLSATGAIDGPDLYIVDLRNRPSIPPWLPTLRRHPGAPGMIVLLASLDSALILQAMRAGVSECLAEPLTQADLEAAIARLTSDRTSAAVGSVFSFVGAKGGVGTTTTAVNVATALRSLPASVLLIDLHLTHGDAAVFLGVEPRFSVVDALESIHRLDKTAFDALVTKTKGGPDLLASSDRSLVGSPSAESIRLLVQFAASRYRYVVLDVPRSDPNALDALDATTHVVVVANQELATVRNAARISEALRVRYGKERVSVLVSRYDTSAEIGHDDVERVTGVRVRATVPSDYRLALQSLNAGRPLMLSNHSDLAASFRDLARSLAAVPERSDDGDKPIGLLGRILGRRS